MDVFFCDKKKKEESSANMHPHVYREKDNRITGRVFQRRKKKDKMYISNRKKKENELWYQWVHTKKRERGINKSISIARKIYHRRKENELI